MLSSVQFVGALMSDYQAGDKIAANMAVIMTCRGMALQQHQQVLALLAAVQQEAAQAGQAAAQAEADARAEAENAFAELRAAAQ